MPDDRTSHLSIRLADSDDVYKHTSVSECAHITQVPQASDVTVECTTHNVGKYLSIQKTDGDKNYLLVLCEVIITGRLIKSEYTAETKT